MNDYVFLPDKLYRGAQFACSLFHNVYVSRFWV